MKRDSSPPEVGQQVYKSGQWVQTDRAAHEAWGKMMASKPTAGALLHILVAKMGQQNAVVVSQKVLAELLGVTDRTIRNALADLSAGNWIQVVRIGKGREAAYVINDRVAWGQPRHQLPLSLFSATIVADARDQDETALSGPELRRIPMLYAGERQLPAGPGEPPPVQEQLEGIEHELPTREDALHREELERRGQLRIED